MTNVNKMYDDCIESAKAITDAAVASTKYSDIGIIGALIAASVMAQTQGWTRQRLDEAFHAAASDTYNVAERPRIVC